MEDIEFQKLLIETSAQYRNLLNDELEARWNSIALDLSKTAEYEVIWGMVARQCSLVYQMSYSYFTWNDFYLPIIMRCMVENHINISWILINPSERAQMFIDYGLSNETKNLEYLKNKSDKSENDLNYIQNKENWINQQRYTFLNKINIGSWNFSNVRKTAEEAGCKEYYDLMYPICSSATHSTWDYIVNHNLIECNNPLHKFHKIPKIKEPEIEIGMFLILTKILQDTFEKIDNELNIKIDSPSSFEYIKNAFNSNDEKE